MWKLAERADGAEAGAALARLEVTLLDRASRAPSDERLADGGA
jgi:hypothetical protein